MRRCLLVCYDIADPKRLRRMHKMMKGFGVPWQYSVFFCVLKDSDCVRLRTTIEEIVHHNEDQVLTIDLGNDEHAVRRNIKVFGENLPELESGIIVV